MITKCGHRYFNDTDGDVWEDEPEPVYKCGCCGFGIFSGDSYYDIGGEPICYYCARNCAIVLRKHGGMVRKPIAPICDFCKSEINEEYIAFRGKNYCKDCISDYGDDLTEEIFGVSRKNAD